MSPNIQSVNYLTHQLLLLWFFLNILGLKHRLVISANCSLHLYRQLRARLTYFRLCPKPSSELTITSSERGQPGVIRALIVTTDWITPAGSLDLHKQLATSDTYRRTELLKSFTGYHPQTPPRIHDHLNYAHVCHNSRQGMDRHQNSRLTGDLFFYWNHPLISCKTAIRSLDTAVGL